MSPRWGTGHHQREWKHGAFVFRAATEEHRRQARSARPQDPGPDPGARPGYGSFCLLWQRGPSPTTRAATHSDVLRYSRRANDRSNSLRNLPNREAARRYVSGRDPPADRSEPPALEPWPVDRQDSESPDAAETTLRIRDSSSGWAPPEKPGLGPKPDLAPPVALTPEPVESELSALESVPETLSLEEGHPPSWLAEVVPVPEPGVPEAQAPLSSSPEDSDDGVAETLENTVLGASRTLVEGPTLPPIVEMENNGLLDAALASLLPDGEVNRAPAAERSEDPASPSAGSTGPENPSDGAPQPASPIAPLLGGSSFSSSGGQAGLGGGGFAPLLLICVLASGLVLLRRDGLLHRTSCEPPKPSSALLAPLERPG